MSNSAEPKKSGTWSTVLLFAAAVLVVLLIIGLVFFVLPDDEPQTPTVSEPVTTVLNDTITATAWGEAATIVSGEDSPAEAAHSGYTYGTIGQGTEVLFSGTIANDGNITEVWYHPLVGIYSGSTGFVCRMDNWVVGGSPDGEFTNIFDEAPVSGTADAASDFWAVYMSGDSWTAETAKSSTAYSVAFAYTDSGVITITQTIVLSDTEFLTQVYSVHVPEGEYNTYFYGENCSYTFSSMTVTEI